MPLIVKRFSVGEYRDIISDEAALTLINSAKKTLQKNEANHDINKFSLVKKKNK
ncbi:MAG TPA: hypothetical protein ACHBZ9_19010 [Arsenophonus nasoniae]|uniref:hypothetical protein n=1 Tax=Arsenophonus nasoniae TaxID=638 RepID=UPI00387A4695